MSGSYNCGVLNCGGGQCVHELTCDSCPCCGHAVVLVLGSNRKPNGVAFCSQHEFICDWMTDNYFGEK